MVGVGFYSKHAGDFMNKDWKWDAEGHQEPVLSLSPCSPLGPWVDLPTPSFLVRDPNPAFTQSQCLISGKENLIDPIWVSYPIIQEPGNQLMGEAWLLSL